MSKKQRDSLHAEVQRQLQQQQQQPQPPPGEGLPSAYSLGVANGHLKLAPSPDLLEASSCSAALLSGTARLGQAADEAGVAACANGRGKAQSLLGEDFRGPFAKDCSPERIKMEGMGGLCYTLELQASPQLSCPGLGGGKRPGGSELGGEILDFYTTPSFTSLLESPNSSLTEIGEWVGGCSRGEGLGLPTFALPAAPVQKAPLSCCGPAPSTSAPLGAQS